MRIKDIMKTPVYSIELDAPADRATAEMRRRGIHHLVVMKNGSAVGVLSDRDVAARAVANLDWTAGDLMTSDPVTATPDTTVREAASRLRGHNIGCLPVIDDEQLVGIVTTSDLLEYIAREER